MKIAILSDSSCTTSYFQKKYKDFYYLPLLINDENGNERLDDDNFSEDEFYSLMETSLLKTSLTPLGILREKLDKLLTEYDQVILLLLSKGLSGQYNSVRLGIDEDKYKDKVFNVDTNGVSIILDHLIDEAFALIAENKNGIEIQSEIEKINNDFECLIIPKTLDNLVRGGRITKMAAAMAKMLKITPILRYTGIIDKEGKSRTFRKAVSDALDLIIERCPEENKIDIACSRMNPENKKIVLETIKDKKMEVNLNHMLPNVITVHTGAEAVLLTSWKKWR